MPVEGAGTGNESDVDSDDEPGGQETPPLAAIDASIAAIDASIAALDASAQEVSRAPIKHHASEAPHHEDAVVERLSTLAAPKIRVDHEAFIAMYVRVRRALVRRGVVPRMPPRTTASVKPASPCICRYPEEITGHARDEPREGGDRHHR